MTLLHPESTVSNSHNTLVKKFQKKNQTLFLISSYRYNWLIVNWPHVSSLSVSSHSCKWLCSSSTEEGEFVFLPFESGLALEFALANRMWRKWLLPGPSLWLRGPCMFLSLPATTTSPPSCWRTRHRQKSAVGPSQPACYPLHTRASPAEIHYAQISRTAQLTPKLKGKNKCLLSCVTGG